MYGPMFSYWYPDYMYMDMGDTSSSSEDSSGEDTARCGGQGKRGRRCRPGPGCGRRCRSVPAVSEEEDEAKTDQPRDGSPTPSPSTKPGDRRRPRFQSCPPGDRERMWRHMRKQWRQRRMMAHFMRQMHRHHGFMHGPPGPVMGGPHFMGGPHRFMGGPHGTFMHGPHGFMGGPHGFMGGPHGFMGGPHGFMGGPCGFMAGGPHDWYGGPWSGKHGFGDSESDGEEMDPRCRFMGGRRGMMGRRGCFGGRGMGGPRGWFRGPCSGRHGFDSESEGEETDPRCMFKGGPRERGCFGHGGMRGGRGRGAFFGMGGAPNCPDKKKQKTEESNPKNDENAVPEEDARDFCPNPMMFGFGRGAMMGGCRMFGRRGRGAMMGECGMFGRGGRGAMMGGCPREAFGMGAMGMGRGPWAAWGGPMMGASSAGPTNCPPKMKSMWRECVPIGQGITRDQVKVEVVGNKVSITAKNDSSDAVQDLNEEVIIPDDVDKNTVKTWVRPKKGFIVIAGKKTEDDSHPEKPCRAEIRAERMKLREERQQRKKCRWVERVQIGQGFQREQVEVKIEDNKVTIHAKNNNAEENREITKNITIPDDIDMSTVETRVRPRMGFVVIIGKRKLVDQQEPTEDSADVVSGETAMEVECPSDQEKSNGRKANEVSEYANEWPDNMLGSDNDIEQAEDLSWDVYDMTSAGAEKDPVDDEQTWVLVPGQDKKAESFKLDIDLSPFTPEEVNIKIVGREIRVSANHYENEDGYSVQQKFERKYRLPNKVEAKAVRSKMTLDGVLTISAPASAEKDLVIEQSTK